jgi:hypothetical protein
MSMRHAQVLDDSVLTPRGNLSAEDQVRQYSSPQTVSRHVSARVSVSRIFTAVSS